MWKKSRSTRRCCGAGKRKINFRRRGRRGCGCDRGRPVAAATLAKIWPDRRVDERRHLASYAAAGGGLLSRRRLSGLGGSSRGGDDIGRLTGRDGESNGKQRDTESPAANRPAAREITRSSQTSLLLPIAHCLIRRYDRDGRLLRPEGRGKNSAKWPAPDLVLPDCSNSQIPQPFIK